MNPLYFLQRSLRIDHAIPLQVAFAERLIPDLTPATLDTVRAAGHHIGRLTAPRTGYATTRITIDVISMNEQYANLVWYQQEQNLGLRAMRVAQRIPLDPFIWTSNPKRTTLRSTAANRFAKGRVPDGTLRWAFVEGTITEIALEWSSGRLSETLIRERIHGYGRPHQIWGTSSRAHALKLQAFLDDILGKGGPHRVLCVPWWR